MVRVFVYFFFDCGSILGSQDGLAKIFDMLLNPGDTLLTESPTYSGALAALLPLQANLVGVPCDAEGIVPEALSAKLEEDRPKVSVGVVVDRQKPQINL